MGEISRVALFGKLNSLAYKAMEGATVFCKLRGNPVRRAGTLAATDPADSGLRSASHRQAFRDRRITACERPDRALDRLPRGATSISDLSHACGKCGRARLGLWLADVRRDARAHGPSGRRHSEDPFLTQCAVATSRGSSNASSPIRSPTSFANVVAGSPEDAPAHRGDAPRVPSQVKRAVRWRRLQMGKQEALQAFRCRSDRASAQGRDRPDQRA